MRYKKSLFKKFLKIHRQAPMPAARFNRAAGLNLVFRVLRTFSEELFRKHWRPLSVLLNFLKRKPHYIIHGCGGTVGGRPQP